jgi:hypothetical protein
VKRSFEQGKIRFSPFTLKHQACQEAHTGFELELAHQDELTVTPKGFGCHCVERTQRVRASALPSRATRRSCESGAAGVTRSQSRSRRTSRGTRQRRRVASTRRSRP